eukprot:symbB.v1.2.017079.t1/scaffold1312.1/size125759/1
MKELGLVRVVQRTRTPMRQGGRHYTTASARWCFMSSGMRRGNSCLVFHAPTTPLSLARDSLDSVRTVNVKMASSRYQDLKMIVLPIVAPRCLAM